MITRLQYFSNGVIFGVSLLYLVNNGFLLSPFVIVILSILAYILMERREYFEELLKRKRGE